MVPNIKYEIFSLSISALIDRQVMFACDFLINVN